MPLQRRDPAAAMARAWRDGRPAHTRDASHMWPVATWQLCRNFVLSQLALRPASARTHPLVVGVQGPQGSGKSTLVRRLATELSSGGYRLRVAVLSIDDLYLPAPELEALRTTHPGNGLYEGRGMPGTHDVDLGERILANMRGQEPPPGLRESPQYPQTAEHAYLPIYDKSAHGGRGDRASEAAVIPSPRELDVFLIEGWCLGYAPLGADGVRTRYNEALVDGRSSYMTNYPLGDLQMVDTYVAQYAERWCSYLDAMVQLWPVKGITMALELGDIREAQKPMWSYVFQWRKEAEHKLRAEMGEGMTDEQVEAFVARYMPAYEMWAASELTPPLARATMLGPGPADGAKPSPAELEGLKLPDNTDEQTKLELEALAHAPPQHILRIDLDARRSVQHFTLS